MLFALLAAKLPFDGDEESDEACAALRAKVEAGVWDVQPECSESAKILLRRMLEVDPGKRATLEEVVSHQWVGGVKALKEHQP